MLCHAMQCIDRHLTLFRLVFQLRDVLVCTRERHLLPLLRQRQRQMRPCNAYNTGRHNGCT
jgi:hypothetical protein